jgi:hypothetical protein
MHQSNQHSTCWFISDDHYHSSAETTDQGHLHCNPRHIPHTEAGSTWLFFCSQALLFLKSVTKVEVYARTHPKEQPQVCYVAGISLSQTATLPASSQTAMLPAFHWHKLPRCWHFIITNCYVAGNSSSESTHTLNMYGILPEVVIWGPEQGYFRNVARVFGRNCLFSCLGPRGSPCSDDTWAWNKPVPAHTSSCPQREPYFSPPLSHISPPTDLIYVIFIWIEF